MEAFRLVLGAVLVNAVVAAALAAALASFAGQALSQAALRQIETAPRLDMAISGAATLTQARTATKAIGQALHGAFGPIPVTLYSSLWSNSLGLPPAAQSAAARSAGRPATPAGGRAAARSAGGHAAPVRLLQAAAPTGLVARSVLVRGSWPAAGPGRPGQPVPAALPAASAGPLRLAVGSVLTLHDRDTGAPVRIRVTGLFRPRDPTASYWDLNLIGASGSSQQGGFVTYGPLVVDPAVFGSGQIATGGASWVAMPDAGRFGGDLVALGRRVSAVASTFSLAPQFGGLHVSTGLPELLRGVGANVVVARSVLVIGGLQLLILVAAALTLASRALAGQREAESALLSARGGSPGQLTMLNAAETVLLAVAAAVAGALLGGRLAVWLAGAGPLRGSGIQISALPAVAWWAAAAAAVVCVGIALGPALRPPTPEMARQRRGRAAVVAGVARAGGDISLIVLALLTGWQLRRYSPLGTSSGLGVDPVLAAAPALALAAGTVVLLRLMPLAARAGDRLAARSRKLLGSLAIWEISRNPVRRSGIALLVVLGVATGTLALAQHDSWRRSAADQAAFTVGADVRVNTPAPVPLGQAAGLAHAPGVLAAMPVARVALPATGGTLIALNPRQAAGTVLLRPDLSPRPPAALWRSLHTPTTAGAALPGHPSRLAISASLGPARHGLHPATATLSVRDATGVVYQVPAGVIPADGRSHRLVASLAPGRRAVYPLALIAIGASYQLPTANPRVQAALTVRTAAVSAAPAGPFAAPFMAGRALRAWTPTVSAAELKQAPAYGHTAMPGGVLWQAAAAGAQTLSFQPGYGQVRFTGPGIHPPQPVQGNLLLTAGTQRIPVIPGIATRSLLAAAHTGVGGFVPVALGSLTLQVKVVAAVTHFPTVTGGGALLVDQGAVDTILTGQGAPPLAVSQWWLRTAAPGLPARLPPAASATRLAPVTAGLLADPVSDVPQQALLAIAVAAALLAALGFAVSILADAAQNASRAALLAALGMSPVQQARMHAAEELMLSVPAALVGLLVGDVIAQLLIPAVTLTAAARTPVPPALVVFNWPQALLLAAIVAAAPALAAVIVPARHPDPAARLRAAEEG
ncbi:MAG TPA: FtsX-like permease family protein [Streptosporangiaceae bacterium]|jgi:hypothetical protein